MNEPLDEAFRAVPQVKPESSNALAEIWNSALNAALLDPLEGLEKTARQLAAADTQDTFFKRVHVTESEFLSGQWLCQGVASGLGSVVPYSIAQKIVGGKLRLVGSAFKTSGLVSSVFKSNSLAQVLGAASLDVLKAPKPEETRVGNAAGSMVAFSIYELSNYAFSKKRLALKIPTLIATGSGAAWAQYGISGLFSGREYNAEAAAQAAIGGGVLNLALPVAQEGLSRGIGWSTKKLGFGIPIERHVGQLPTELKSTQAGQTLEQVSSINPWLRVQDGASENSYKVARNLISTETRLRPTENIEIAKTHLRQFFHEAQHHKEFQAKTAEGGFDLAAHLLKYGDEAKSFEVFRKTRLAQELRASLAEDAWLTSLNPPERARQIDLLKTTLPVAEAAGGLTYELMWQREFAAFKNSNGKLRPEVDYMPSKGSVPDWSELIKHWDGQTSGRKSELLGQLETLASGYRWNLWQRAIKDEAVEVRIVAADNIHKLSDAQMVAAWRAMMHSNDYLPRVTALTHLKHLPLSERTNCWMMALNQAETFQARKEKSSIKTYKHVGDLWVSSGDHVPHWPGQASQLRKTLQKSPAEHMVASISSLPIGDRKRAWTLAFGDRRTATAAAENISPVPLSGRLETWSEAWQRGRGQKVLDGLVGQIAVLQKGDRVLAWNEVAKTHADIKGASIESALSSLRDLNDPSLVFKYWNEIKNPKLAAKAIRALPEDKRFWAWLRLSNRQQDVPSRELAEAILDLPSDCKIEAFKRATEKHPYGDLKLPLIDISKRDIVRAVDLVFSMPHCFERNGLLGTFESRFWYMDTEIPSLDARIEIVEGMFKTALKHLSKEDSVNFSDYEYLRNWWGNLPEKFDENIPEFLQKQPIKEHLLSVLDAKHLGRIVFAGKNHVLSDALSEKYPNAIRELAKESWLNSHSKHDFEIVPLLNCWLETGSIKDTLKVAFNDVGETECVTSNIPVAISAIVKNAASNPSEICAVALKELRDLALAPDRDLTNAAKIALATGTKLIQVDSELSQQHFLEPIESALRDPQHDYSWKMELARTLSRFGRWGYLGDFKLELPSLRMPAPVKLSRHEQLLYQHQIESELFSAQKLGKSLVSGTLGQLFPKVIGSDGGIVGRPQHGGHVFDLHVHTLHVVNKTREHPEFKKLSKKDQVNLLWAALLHDVGKQSGEKDPDHEWVSGNITWGILQSLGYPPQRIQRIVDLISRHGEMSFQPGKEVSERLNDEFHRDELAKHYSYPHAGKQLAILNEADIRSIDARSTLWTEGVAQEIDSATRLIGKTIKDNYPVTIPLLTSEVPNQFGLHQMKNDYALLVHKSFSLEDHFLNHLASIESPQYSISASLVTPSHNKLYDAADFVAVVAGPPEHISQADRHNLGTGTETDWKRHIELSKSWLKEEHDQEFVNELDKRLAKLGMNAIVKRGFKHLHKLWQELSQFDTADELLKDVGEDGLLYKALKDIHNAFTTNPDGKPTGQHNEIKLNCPTVTGVGIFRKNRPLYLENFNSNHLETLLGTTEKPEWLIIDGDKPKETLVVPESLWKTAMTKQLPLVVLDP